MKVYQEIIILNLKLKLCISNSTRNPSEESEIDFIVEIVEKNS
jgi:hypothetical protein